MVAALEKSFKRIQILKEIVDSEELKFGSDSSSFGDAAISLDQKTLVVASQSTSELLVISIEPWKVIGSSVHLLDHTINIEFINQLNFLLYSAHAQFSMCQISSSATRKLLQNESNTEIPTEFYNLRELQQNSPCSCFGIKIDISERVIQGHLTKPKVKKVLSPEGTSLVLIFSENFNQIYLAAIPLQAGSDYLINVCSPVGML